jgi:broad specificity phosphatase PhoE
VATLLLARHGESDWNREDRWQGHADRPLTPLGRRQARALAARLARTHLDAIYASDLERARATADAVAAGRGLAVVTRRDLREVDVGTWTGLSWAEVEHLHPDGRARWQAGETGWDGGESYAAMARRVAGALREIAAEHDGGLVLVVAHGGPMRAALAEAAGLDIAAYRRTSPTPGNGDLAAVEVVGGAFRRADPDTILRG